MEYSSIRTIAFASLIVVGAAVSACSDPQPSAFEPAPIAFSEGEDPAGGPVDGLPDLEFFEVCKEYVGGGPMPDVNIDVDVVSHDAGPISFSVTLGAGECDNVWLHGGSGAGTLDLVTVTENPVPANYTASFGKTTIGPDNSDENGPGNSASGNVNGDNGVVVTFTNTFVPPPPVEGRMTGGGSFFENGTRFTHGFTLHCDGTPNNLEINWNGNRFHLTSLTSAVCIDDPSLNPLPRSAPFDTFIGQGIGRLNGVDGATIVFTLTDGGEPGRRDFAAININGGAIVADGFLRNGNHQAHPENK